MSVIDLVVGNGKDNYYNNATEDSVDIDDSINEDEELEDAGF